MLQDQDLVEALPPQMRKGLNQATLETIANVIADPDAMERFKENFITYTTALTGQKYSLQQYIDAVMYVSYKKMGYKNNEAFRRTFPKKMDRYYRENKTEAHINALVSSYNKTLIVTKIMEQSMIPVHILNQDAFQAAVNAQLRILNTSKNDLAVVKAADSLMNHLKPPTETKVQIDVGIQETPMQQEFKQESARLAQLQRELILSGKYTAKQIAEMPVVVQGEARYVESD